MKFSGVPDSSFLLFPRLALSEQQKRLFEKLSIYCDRYAEQIPVTFVLGTLTDCTDTSNNTYVTAAQISAQPPETAGFSLLALIMIMT